MTDPARFPIVELGCAGEVEYSPEDDRTGGRMIWSNRIAIDLRWVGSIEPHGPPGWNAVSITMCGSGIHRVVEGAYEDLMAMWCRAKGIPAVPQTAEFKIEQWPPLEDAEWVVDLDQRRVTHKESGIVFTFPEWKSAMGWFHSASCTILDNPTWIGDRLDLANRAHGQAIYRGMGPKREPRPK